MHDNYANLVLKSILEEGFTDQQQIEIEFRTRISLFPQAAKALVTDAIIEAKNDKRTSRELDKELFGSYIE